MSEIQQVKEGTEESTEVAGPVPPPDRCYAVKHGRVDLTCELDEGHEGWHKATFTDHQEIIYQGAHHVVDMTETVTWEGARRVIAAALRQATAKGQAR